MTPPWLAGLLSARVHDLEQPRHAGMPIWPGHRPGYFYALHRRHRDTYKPDGHGPRTAASGVVTMMEHTGTHIDALSHQGDCMRLFGGVHADEVETPAGFTRLGVDEIPPLVRRGVLLDIAGHQGVERLPPSHPITADEMEACRSAQNTDIRPNDVLLIRTGYDTLWHDEAAYLAAAGVAKSGTLWAADHGVCAVGADNMTWDVPGERDPETGATLFGHVYLLPKKGIYILENLKLDELAHNNIHTFAFIGLPLKMRGATGSPLRPVAIA
jgi:kynurenine formamidase